MTSLYPKYQSRIQIVALAIFLIVFILLIKIFSIQIIHSNKYKQLVNENTIREIVKKGDRGIIYDVNGNILAETIKKYNFWVNTHSDFDENLIVKALSNEFQMPSNYYSEKLKKKAPYVILEKNVPQFIALPILKKIKTINGLRAEGLQVRHYPYKNLFSQIVGYVDKDGLGRVGIEKKFNDILNADTKSFKYDKSSSGYLNQNIDVAQPIINNGKSITLTINSDIQQILHSEISKGVEKFSAKSANGIVLDPNNGNILAMVSLPDYNPNNYYEYDMQTYNNHSISSAYEPGSTYKIVTTALALDSKMITLNQEFDCENGEYIYSSKKNPYLFKKIHDHEPNKILSVEEILIESSNIGIFKIADLVGPENIYKFSKKFGFGTKTGIELPNESSGSLKEFEKWDWLSNNSIAIGQELSSTTLQTALAYASIANGGYLLKPTIIKDIEYENNLPTVVRKVIGSETANQIIDVLINVVENGTGTNAYIKGYNIAGKTGTAEKFIDGEYSKTEFISSFASFFPAHNAKYVIVINVDSPKYGYHWGNESAGRITKGILGRLISNDYELHPQIVKNNDKINNFSINDKDRDLNISLEVMPNFKGKTLKEVIMVAKKIGVHVEPFGYTGKVVWQSAPAGSNINENPICKIKLENG